MPLVLAFNPGSASLKFELIEVFPRQTIASDASKRFSASIEGLGKQAKLLVFEGRKIASTEPAKVHDMAEGARFALQWLQDKHARLGQLALIGVRVVHGGSKYSGPVRFDPEVRRDIEALAELAPLHNRNSLAIFSVLELEVPGVPLIAAFDTAFHRTLPEVAWRYPIEREIADRFEIRKFGFHGLSHRFMMEQYAQTVGKRPDEVSIITLHLESGASAAAIAKGRSIDTTMGLTPLEGLMMGTRSGSVDPAVVPFLMKKMGADGAQVMTLLNHRSGLLGIAGETFDTRDLVKRGDALAKLALEMFSYRVRLAVGAYLAALGDAEAVVFGGGIGEDTPVVRAQVCAGLRGWGADFDEELNAKITAGPACLTRPGSRLQVHVSPVEEGLEIAHECYQAFQSKNA